MAKTREIACVHYKAEGDCDLGKAGTMRKQCQTCKSYKKLPGGKVKAGRGREVRARKREKAAKYDMRDMGY